MSKMTTREKLEALLRKTLNRETIAYLISGVLVTIFSFIIYFSLIKLNYGVVEANTGSFVLAVIFAFIINKVYVFQSHSFKMPFVAVEFFKFVAARLFTYALETALLVVMVDWMLLSKVYTKIFTSVLVVVLNYIISKIAVFK